MDRIHSGGVRVVSAHLLVVVTQALLVLGSEGGEGEVAGGNGGHISS